MAVQFVDLKIQYDSLKNEIDKAINSVISETAFIKGKYVNAFEDEFAKALGVKHCIGVANGTDALYVALTAMGIGNGDEVITVANSWISTSETISLTGATPVFVDIDSDHYTIDPEKIESKINVNTKAIIPVHLYGQPAEMDKIKAICNKHNLLLLEDCAQAHFAEYNTHVVGTFGNAATFSFYPGKNLGAYGDAGAIVTNDDALAEKMRVFANHGQLEKHNHIIEGINSRLDGLQAAILSVKLKYIFEWNSMRYNNALLYNELLKDVEEVVTPAVRSNSTHIFHLYVIRAKEREGLIKYLNENEIHTAIHYPTPLPLLPAYKRLNYSERDIPVADSHSREILSLPMYPELTENEIETVCGVIKQFYNA